mgnify:CR=1 FL=1
MVPLIHESEQLNQSVLWCAGGGQEEGAIFGTIGGKDADAERTWMYLQRVPKIAPSS